MSDGVTTSPILPLAEATTPRPMGITERNFYRSMIYSAIIVLVFWCAFKVERDVLMRRPGEIRYIREASEAAMRYITIPHILIGFLFMVTSLSNRTPRKRAWIVGLLLAGVGLCLLYWGGGAKTNLLLYSGVYLYFMVHELRDEAMFYSVLGDAAPIPDGTAFRNMIRVLIGLIVASVGAIAWALAPFGIYYRKIVAEGSALSDASWAHSTLFDGSLPVVSKLTLALVPLAALVGAYVATLRHFSIKMGYPRVKVLVYSHAPLFRVMAGVTAVLGLSLLITERAYSLILFHVVAWYVFAACQFARRPPKLTPKGAWLWMRTTVRGFKTLHIGMVVVLMALGLVWTLALGQTPALGWLLRPESFLYWTIIHITVSFVPR
ncbi:MAG: hypothetical protein ACE5EC_02080 [Phycisphaerae bacterium]